MGTRLAAGSALAAIMLAWAGQILAFPVDMGDSDWRLRTDHTFRYNWAQRLGHRDSRIAGNGSFDQGDALFDRGDTIANRLDWLGEFDLRFREDHGLRVSAAAWFDDAYGSHGKLNPAALPSAAPSYANNEFTHAVGRYYRGPSGEILDAFGYTAVELGEAKLHVKIGRHAVVWGESLFGSAHAVAYGQTPADGRKSVANPGASAKETALPIGQVSVLLQISPELTLLAQSLYEWRPNRVPEGGTYFGGSDTTLEGPNIARLSALEGARGDWGLGIKWNPDWLGGTLGLYRRRFDDKGAWAAQAVGGGVTRAVYARGVDLWGLTAARSIAGVSVGAELSRRGNGALTSDPATSAGAAGGYAGARGNTWHAVINAVASLGPSPVYHSASLATELAWSRLDRVTSNAKLYRASGYNPYCASNAGIKGCADAEFLGASLSFTPTWLQALPGVDLELPLFYSAGLRGNAPSNGGGSEDFVTWKIGLTAKAFARHQFDLAYTGYQQKMLADPSVPSGYRILGAPYKDKGWLSFTYQTTF